MCLWICKQLRFFKNKRWDEGWGTCRPCLVCTYSSDDWLDRQHCAYADVCDKHWRPQQTVTVWLFQPAFLDCKRVRNNTTVYNELLLVTDYIDSHAVLLRLIDSIATFSSQHTNARAASLAEVPSTDLDRNDKKQYRLLSDQVWKSASDSTSKSTLMSNMTKSFT